MCPMYSGSMLLQEHCRRENIQADLLRSHLLQTWGYDKLMDFLGGLGFYTDQPALPSREIDYLTWSRGIDRVSTCLSIFLIQINSDSHASPAFARNNKLGGSTQHNLSEIQNIELHNATGLKLVPGNLDLVNIYIFKPQQNKILRPHSQFFCM